MLWACSAETHAVAHIYTQPRVGVEQCLTGATDVSTSERGTFLTKILSQMQIITPRTYLWGKLSFLSSSFGKLGYTCV